MPFVMYVRHAGVSCKSAGRYVGRKAFVLGSFDWFELVKNVLWCHVIFTYLFSAEVTRLNLRFRFVYLICEKTVRDINITSMDIC